MDEWVNPDRLDVKKIQFPKKEAKTPTKNGLPGSRPSSPEREVVRESVISEHILAQCSPAKTNKLFLKPFNLETSFGVNSNRLE